MLTLGNFGHWVFWPGVEFFARYDFRPRFRPSLVTLQAVQFQVSNSLKESRSKTNIIYH